MSISREFWAFLHSVDAPIVRSGDYLKVVGNAFLNNTATDAADLIGFDVLDAKKGVHICIVHLGSLYVPPLCTHRNNPRCRRGRVHASRSGEGD